jgi:glycosyltransferase involved in cell wall biosynthesis
MSQVSVIIPTFNRHTVVARAIDSVLAQTFRDFELIVIDDGSTDGTDLSPWPEIRTVKIANGGVSRARNLGAALATSSWLAFLDSDDEWLPEKLAKQMQLVDQFPLIHTEEIWIRNGVRVNQMKKHYKSGGQVFERCVDLCFISPSTTMIRRDLFLRLGGFREDFPVCEDYDLWLKVAAAHEVGFIAEPLSKKYGGNPDQLSLSFPAMDYYRVKALSGHLLKPKAAASLVARADILLKGYQKYPNADHSRDVREWRQMALNALTHSHSAHSAAERLPRSDASPIL